MFPWWGDETNRSDATLCESDPLETLPSGAFQRSHWSHHFWDFLCLFPAITSRFEKPRYPSWPGHWLATSWRSSRFIWKIFGRLQRRSGGHQMDANISTMAQVSNTPPGKTILRRENKSLLNLAGSYGSVSRIGAAESEVGFMGVHFYCAIRLPILRTIGVIFT
jgi:hypothetical protein